ncbi:TPA: hypothetical protein EYP45_04515, partial [Candidatus Peregrinibacteria bacterium]|nr:hypothetical protein [Candidatus Peregrinibacteria bacterium]
TSDYFRESKEITLSMLSDMERLKALGNSKLLGISPENTPNHSLNGVASFKLKFGGTRIICDDGLDFPM